VTAAVGQDATQVVVGVEVAEHPPSPVQEHEETEIFAIVRSVQPSGHTARVEISDLMDRLRRRSLSPGADLARFGRCALFEGRLVEGGHESEKCFRLRMQGHAPILPCLFGHRGPWSAP
jgi:hypothetical protein